MFNALIIGAETSAAMTAITSGITQVFDFVGTALTEITSNEVLCFILAASLVGIILGVLSRVKNTAR